LKERGGNGVASCEGAQKLVCGSGSRINGGGQIERREGRKISANEGKGSATEW
jgi:hypothetical protein